MLVLSRRLEQSIVVAPGTPDEITITVVSLNGERVKLGITAPRHITVHRLEVAQRVAREAASRVRYPDDDTAEEE